MVSREKDLLQAEKQKAEEISQSVTAMAEQQTVLLALTISHTLLWAKCDAFRFRAAGGLHAKARAPAESNV